MLGKREAKAAGRKEAANDRGNPGEARPFPSRGEEHPGGFWGCLRLGLPATFTKVILCYTRRKSHEKTGF